MMLAAGEWEVQRSVSADKPGNEDNRPRAMYWQLFRNQRSQEMHAKLCTKWFCTDSVLQNLLSKYL